MNLSEHWLVDWWTNQCIWCIRWLIYMRYDSFIWDMTHSYTYFGTWLLCNPRTNASDAFDSLVRWWRSKESGLSATGSNVDSCFSMSECVCVRERLCVCEREDMSECVCVRERLCVCERERACLNVCERLRVCLNVCVCVREIMCVW